MNVLILGGGNSSKRYVESLIWYSDKHVILCGFSVRNKTKLLSKRYGLDYIEYANLTNNFMSDIDVLIVTLPPNDKYAVVNYIITELNYKKTIILEKPLTINRAEIDLFRCILKKCKNYAVVCQRDFILDTYSIEPSSKYSIRCSSIFECERQNVVHMMPHILSLLMSISDTVDNVKRIGVNKYTLRWRGGDVLIEFFYSDGGVLKINNTSYPPVQYRELNNRIVEQVYRFTVSQSEESLAKAANTCDAIFKLLLELNNVG